MFRRRLFKEKDGRRLPFDVVIHDPVLCTDSPLTYTCKVEASGLFSRPIGIHGVDAAQAAGLAERLLEILLADFAVYDDAGRRVLRVDSRRPADL